MLLMPFYGSIFNLRLKYLIEVAHTCAIRMGALLKVGLNAVARGGIFPLG